MRRWDGPVDPGDQNVERRKEADVDPLQGGLFDDPKPRHFPGSTHAVLAPGCQVQKILAYIREHGSITARDAIGFGCYRLAARIADLRRAGYPIKTTLEGHDGGQHARYTEASDE